MYGREKTMEDSYRQRGMRNALVRKIREKGINDSRVLEAIGKVPRHVFFDQAFLEHAYQDKAFPIGEGQTISQPYTVAYQSQLLAVKPGDKILEIGTGSGYQACILMELGARLCTIEYNQVLYNQAKTMLRQMGYGDAVFINGDGSQGWPAYAPYNGIIVTAAAPVVPEPLIRQLNIGGRLVIPVGNAAKQKMLRIIKEDEKKLLKETFDNFSFVPLVGKHGWQ
ncbi:MAG: protein-L-isoaspartate(D-aspartate) O-methyltransferase [Cyclobacteriaceae bacterium]